MNYWLRVMAGLMYSALCYTAAVADAAELALRQGDRICFVGNTFAERMRHYGYFETRLTSQFPELGLTFRNLGWSADEIDLQPRPLNFGDIHEHLTKQQADVIFLCYGLNESFEGEAGLNRFGEDLRGYVRTFQSHQYNGSEPARLVLVSPMPQEPIPGMPDVSQRNREIALYAEAMRAAAEDLGVTFVDLFHPVADYQATPDAPPLTFNGIHLEAYGYWVVSQLMMGELGLAEDLKIMEMDADGKGILTISSAARIKTSGASLAITLEELPPPPPPPGVVVDEQLLAGQVRVSVKGLAPGSYALMAGDQELIWASRDAWENGVYLAEGPHIEAVESLRAAIIEKNQLFFDRWRAVNGFYIYGDRKEPFGVVSFPPEMDRFDELVAEQEGKIAEMVKRKDEERGGLVSLDLRLVPVDR